MIGMKNNVQEIHLRYGVGGTVYDRYNTKKIYISWSVKIFFSNTQHLFMRIFTFDILPFCDDFCLVMS